MWPLLGTQRAKASLEDWLLFESLRHVCVCKLFAVVYMHHFLPLCVACDTAQTAGMTEGAEVGNETNCLHFLRVQPLQGTPMNITPLKPQQICDSGK